jgi:hypothetical protein
LLEFAMAGFLADQGRQMFARRRMFLGRDSGCCRFARDEAGITECDFREISAGNIPVSEARSSFDSSSIGNFFTVVSGVGT